MITRDRLIKAEARELITEVPAHLGCQGSDIVTEVVTLMLRLES